MDNTRALHRARNKTHSMGIPRHTEEDVYMEPIYITKVPTDLGMSNTIRTAIRVANRGYDKVVYEGDGYVLMADGYAKIDEDIADTIHDFYIGAHNVSNLLDVDGRPITLSP